MQFANTPTPLLGESPEAAWERLKLMAHQRADRLGLPAVYLSKRLEDLNERQLRKVEKAILGRSCNDYR